MPGEINVCEFYNLISSISCLERHFSKQTKLSKLKLELCKYLRKFLSIINFPTSVSYRREIFIKFRSTNSNFMFSLPPPPPRHFWKRKKFFEFGEIWKFTSVLWFHDSTKFAAPSRAIFSDKTCYKALKSRMKNSNLEWDDIKMHNCAKELSWAAVSWHDRMIKGLCDFNLNFFNASIKVVSINLKWWMTK